MNTGFLLLLIALLLIIVNTAAVPVAPTGLKAEFAEGGVKVSWQHAGGVGVSFNVYRGTSVENAVVIVTVQENFFVDKSVVGGKEYVYLVTTVDASGESSALGSVTITPLAPEEKPFTVTLVEPSDTIIEEGTVKQIDFVLAVESKRFEELENLKAVLLNDKFGLKKEFSFDSQRKLFTLSVLVPEREGSGVLQTTYVVQVTATVAGKPFSESMPVGITLVSTASFDPFQFALNFFWIFGPLFIIVVILGAVVIIWGVWSSRRKTEINRLWLDRVAVQHEMHSWEHKFFKRVATPEQFKEKQIELENRLIAIEEKLRIRREKGKPRVNPFQGFSPGEAEEVMQLVKMVQPKKKGMTKDSMWAWLVGLGKSERIAKKVAEIVFEK